MKKYTLVILTLLSIFYSFSREKKEVTIERTSEKIEVDGDLSELIWQDLPVSTDFVQHIPQTGELSSRRTEVKIFYDNTAIYIGATMYDDRDSMTLTFSQRDDLGNADWFGVIFDPYNAGTIGFAFLVTSAGVQVDELHRVDNIDANWNAVWRSAVTVYEDRWEAEIMIPFSALRFSENGTNDWGINFARNIRRHREESFWNFYDPAGLNLISQLGQMKGLNDVDAPLRLAFSPYVSGYIENYDGNTAYTGNAGMDVKWGINEAFTVDMTLIPDFGQVQFDNNVLNTTPFEVRFNERRQFFTEGTELFNKAYDVFYSRRVGATPFDFSKPYNELDSNEVVISNPTSTRLLNATKFSGRTKKGTGIGVFNAITGRMDAIIQDTITGNERLVRTGPLSNYNMLVFDQNLKNNSSLHLANTNVWREGSAYDANVTAFLADMYTTGQKFNYWFQGNLTQKFHENQNADLGHRMFTGIRKASGNFLWFVAYDEWSRNYDPNDMGFNTITNFRQFNGSVNYNIYKPFWRLYRLWSGLTVSHKRRIQSNEFFATDIYMNVGGTFRNFMTAGGGIYIEPFRPNDYFEPRVNGRFYEGDALIAPDFFISSDYSKPFALDMRGTWYAYLEKGRYGYNLSVSPRIRFNDKWFLILDYTQNNAWNEEGVALTQNFDIPFDPNNPDDPIFAKRDRVTITNTIDLSYILNNKMGITFRLRHYWSKLDYNSFHRLNEDGKMVYTSYTGLNNDDQSLHNNSYNAFTIDMAYRWIFAPGSELSLVWKNSIFTFDDQVQLNYFENVGGMFNNPATNSISLKVLYYIDAWQAVQKIKNRRRN